MKKSVLFAVIATILLGFNNVNAQSSCPVIVNNSFHFNVDQSNPCLKNVTFNFYNPTSGNKNINVIVKVSNVQVINDCVDASGQTNVTRTYTSANFTACSFADIVVTITPYTGNSCGGSACGASVTSVAGAPLPVTFGSFTATKINTSIVLKWETLTEINNRGFAIERNTSGTWEQISFIPSQAINGNSSVRLVYQYNDVNSAKGISQYRIKQIDLDGKATYTEVRAVRNDEQTAKTTVFPNPSFDGKVTVLFSDVSPRDITLFDMMGRAVKQWKGFSSNTLQIDNLTAGMYNLRSVNLENGTPSTDKIVVNNR